MVSMAHTLDFDDPASEIALFRYGLIATLVHDPVSGGQQEERLRQIAAKSVKIPYSRRTSVSISSLRRYLAAWRTGGFDALKPHKRSDGGKPKAFDQATLDRAVALREEQPARTTPMITEHLARDGIRVNAHTLSTHLRKLGKTRRILRKDAKDFRRFERAHVSSLWQGDALHGPWIPDPDRPGKTRRAHLFAFIDDYSRFVPHAEFFFDEQLPRLERVLKIAILKRGLPEALYIDNGKVFHATQFGAACASLKIRKLHAAPYHPEGKGKIERFFGTVREQFLPEVEASNTPDLATLNNSFLAWLERVYHARVHTETGQTPFERFTQGPGFDSIRVPDPETLWHAFLWRTKRHVTKTSTISFAGNTYHIDLGHFLRGQEIELRFDPFDLSKLAVYQEGRPVITVTPVHFKNQVHLSVKGLVNEVIKSGHPKTGDDFLKRLREEHDAELRRQIGAIRYANLPQILPE